MASIAKVDDFYAMALPGDGNKIKKPTSKLIVSVHKRDWHVFHEMPEKKEYKLMAEVGCKRTVFRFIYKTLRCFYASYIFYFLPYTSLWLPYVASGISSS